MHVDKHSAASVIVLSQPFQLRLVYMNLNDLHKTLCKDNHSSVLTYFIVGRNLDLLCLKCSCLNGSEVWGLAGKQPAARYHNRQQAGTCKGRTSRWSVNTARTFGTQICLSSFASSSPPCLKKDYVEADCTISN